MKLAILSVCLLLPSLAFSESSEPAAAKVPRPPQFVMLAFDGSKEIAFWEESRAFTKALRTEKKNARFTYFVSGVYFLHPGNRDLYTAPRLGPGRSAIGWSTKPEDIGPRIDEMNLAFQEKHEIGSHANSHFDGSGLDSSDPMYGKGWAEQDWSDEFRQFNDLIFGAFRNNGISPSAAFPQGYLFSERNVVGFRAPKLGVNTALWPTLRSFNFRYDTSLTSLPNYWPRKNTFGTWNFPLAEIPMAGTAKKTLSMDYNFYVSQTRGTEEMYHADPTIRDALSKQMFDSYVNYFNGNYYGNRAPIHIGHHFSRWNGGAYWMAMQNFARSVCGLKEVRCVTYAEYADWLDARPAKELEALRAGRFEPLKKPKEPLIATEGSFVADADLHREKIGYRAEAVAADGVVKSRGLVPRLSVNGRLLAAASLSREELSRLAPAGEDAKIGVQLFDRDGREVLMKTYLLKNVGTPGEVLGAQPLPDRALQGDLPEAHLGEP